MLSYGKRKKYEPVGTTDSDDAPESATEHKATVTKLGTAFEISQEHVDAKDDPVDPSDCDAHDIYGEVPVQCTCPHCHESVTSTVTLKSSCLTFFLGCVFVLLLGWISFCVLPFLWPVLQDTVHACPRCLNVISQKKRISLPAIKKEIVTFKCGHCAVVLSRKYVVLLLVMALLIVCTLLFRIWARANHVFEISRGDDVSATWREFVLDCGSKGQLGNPIAASVQFDEKYEFKTVTWRGVLDRVEEGLFSNNFVYITMDPPQNTISGNSDLYLFFTEEINEQVSKLDPGDYIQFEATLVQLGRRGQPHLGKLWAITMLQKLSPEDASELPTDLGLFGKLMLVQQLQNVVNGGNPMARTIVISPRFPDDSGMDPFMPDFGSDGPLSALSKDGSADPFTTTTFSTIRGEDGINGFVKLTRSVNVVSDPFMAGIVDDDSSGNQFHSGSQFHHSLSFKRQNAFPAGIASMMIHERDSDDFDLPFLLNTPRNKLSPFETLMKARSEMASKNTNDSPNHSRTSDPEILNIISRRQTVAGADVETDEQTQDINRILEKLKNANFINATDSRDVHPTHDRDTINDRDTTYGRPESDVRESESISESESQTE